MMSAKQTVGQDPNKITALYERLSRDDDQVGDSNSSAERMYLTADPVTGKPFWESCGKGNGGNFVNRSVKELREFTGHTGRILLRVAAWNQRAIRAYQKAGFSYVETIQDEIAYTNHTEDFWVMELL